MAGPGRAAPGRSPRLGGWPRARRELTRNPASRERSAGSLVWFAVGDSAWNPDRAAPDDAQLVARVLGGGLDAYRLPIERHQGALYRLVASLARRILARALAELPDDLRSTLALREIVGPSTGTVAALEGVVPSAPASAALASGSLPRSETTEPPTHAGNHLPPAPVATGPQRSTKLTRPRLAAVRSRSAARASDGRLPPPMDDRSAIEAAAQRFVLAPFRDRFVHEALRKPARLMTRIAHQIDAVFERRFRGGSTACPAKAPCLFFELTGRRQSTTWGLAMDLVRRGGGGVLLIDASGRSFFAQAEGEPPPTWYAGDA